MTRFLLALGLASACAPPVRVRHLHVPPPDWYEQRLEQREATRRAPAPPPPEDTSTSPADLLQREIELDRTKLAVAEAEVEQGRIEASLAVKRGVRPVPRALADAQLRVDAARARLAHDLALLDVLREEEAGADAGEARAWAEQRERDWLDAERRLTTAGVKRPDGG